MAAWYQPCCSDCAVLVTSMQLDQVELLDCTTVPSACCSSVASCATVVDAMQAAVPADSDARFQAWMGSATVFDRLRERLTVCMDVGSNSTDEFELPLVPLVAGVVVGAIAAILIFALGYSRYDDLPASETIVPAQVLPVADVVRGVVAVPAEEDGDAPKQALPIAQAMPIG